MSGTKRFDKLDSRVVPPTPHGALTLLWRNTVKDKGLKPAMGYLLGKYVARVSALDHSLRRKTRSTMISDITADEMTWKKLNILLFKFLCVVKVDLTIKLTFPNSTNSYHTVGIPASVMTPTVAKPTTVVSGGTCRFSRVTSLSTPDTPHGSLARLWRIVIRDRDVRSSMEQMVTDYAGRCTDDADRKKVRATLIADILSDEISWKKLNVLLFNFLGSVRCDFTIKVTTATGGESYHTVTILDTATPT